MEHTSLSQNKDYLLCKNPIAKGFFFITSGKGCFSLGGFFFFALKGCQVLGGQTWGDLQFFLFAGRIY